MNNSPTPLHASLFQLASAAVREGLTALRAAISNDAYVPKRHGWHEINYQDNGMPSLYENSASAPPDYSMMFGQADFCSVDPEHLPTFQAFAAHLAAMLAYQDSIRHRYRDDLPQNELVEEAELRASRVIVHLVDDYQTVYGGAAFSDEQFLPLYLRWEEKVFADRIPVDVVVPLLMLKADCVEHQLAKDVFLWRMDNDFQRARVGALSWDHNIHRWAAAAATHAIVIRNRELTRAQLNQLSGYPWELNNTDVYPMSLIGCALASLRLATGIVTGYAQVLLHYRYRNSEHADKFEPALHAVPVRRYPMHFDHWRWLDSMPCIQRSGAERTASIFEPLSRLPDSSPLAIAARRINDCYSRDRQDDALIDAAIAFETLLSDDEHQEMTHKLALRVAALMRLESNPPASPTQAFREIKQLYAYRSKLVHGKAKAAQKLLEKEFSGDSQRPVTAALSYLGVVMRLLLENECYRKPTEIDRRLLLGENNDTAAEADDE